MDSTGFSIVGGLYLEPDDIPGLRAADARTQCGDVKKYIRLPVVPSDEAITLVIVPFFQGALVH